MDVLIVNDNGHVNGGAAKVAIQEAVGLAQRGHRVHFVCAVAPIAESLIHPNIEICCTFQHDLKSNPSPTSAFVQGLWNAQAARLMRALIGGLNHSRTVIHLHVWSRALSPSVVKIAIDSGLPTVCTLHDFILACPSGTFFNHRHQEICSLEPLSARCILSNCDTRSYPEKLWRVGRQAVQKFMCAAPSGIEHVIVHSTLAGNIMRSHLPARCRIHHLPIYSENTRHPPAQNDRNQKLVYLGRLVREKGVLLAAKASAAEDTPIVFVGSGPLEQEILTANPKALVTGWVDQSRSVSIIREARALIFPSIWYETLGLVVLEAAAHGIPSLVPDRSAACEVVRDGVTGLYFRSGDEADLRAKIRQLQDSSLARSLGRAAYEQFWSSDYCSLAAHISSLEAIYESVRTAELSRRLLPVVPMEVQNAG